MARIARMGAKGGDPDSDAEQDEDKIAIGQQYKKPIPEPEWLQESKINGKNITEWWKTKDQLVIDGISFTDGITKKPSVEEWKEKVKEFIEANNKRIPRKDSWIDNPKGYANILKGTLPFFILVPA
ncbi:hypothetical protein RZS08_24115, partial [Arthrospira platensis SPKY1]|nr:hypothetical protein [Arthrospira platensis SPKY1]